MSDKFEVLAGPVALTGHGDDYDTGFFVGRVLERGRHEDEFTVRVPAHLGERVLSRVRELAVVSGFESVSGNQFDARGSMLIVVAVRSDP